MEVGTSRRRTTKSKVRKRHRHSVARKWLRRNAPHVFLYAVGAVVALALTYWLVRRVERSPGQDTGVLRPGGRDSVAARVPAVAT